MSNWREFLTQAGAQWSDTRAEHFGDEKAEARALLAGNGLADLSHRALIAVPGEDAEKFLQGQLTSDVREVDDEHSQLGALCSPKGRVIATLRLLRHAGNIHLELEDELADTVQIRLQMFLLRAKARLDRVNDQVGSIGVVGETGLERLAESVGALPAGANATRGHGDITLLRLPGPQPRIQVFADFERLQELWTALSADIPPLGARAWALGDTAAGTPRVDSLSSEGFTPQMLNLQLIGAVSFKKGCYTGQEIVARTQYLGQLKKRLYRLRGEADITAGTDLYAANHPGNQSVGRIINASPLPDGGSEALAVIQIKSADGDSVHLGSTDGPILSIEPLPYPLEMPE